MAIILAALAVGCSNAGDDERVRRVELATTAYAQEVDATVARAHRLSENWQDIEARFLVAARGNDNAQRGLGVAIQEYGAASSQAANASAIATRSKARWELFQQLVVLATAIDAANLDAARTQHLRAGSSVDCGANMSTAAYRALLTGQGVNLAGVDVDHIVPRSLGGADNPANYQLLPSSINRSLGATWNEDKCLGVGTERCARAITASRECGTLRGTGF